MMNKNFDSLWRTGLLFVVILLGIIVLLFMFGVIDNIRTWNMVFGGFIVAFITGALVGLIRYNK